LRNIIRSWPLPTGDSGSPTVTWQADAFPPDSWYRAAPTPVPRNKGWRPWRVLATVAITLVAEAATLLGLAVAYAPAPVAAATAAAPVPCPASPTSGTYVHIRLANCVGGPAGDLGRGIRITGGKVVLSTTGLANLQLTHRSATPHPMVTFYIRWRTKYLRVSRTGASLGATPMLFGMYPGAGFNGPRFILRAQSNGKPLASHLGLTAAGTVLKLAPATVASPDSPPNPNQVWDTPFAR
jgi:hypothetical protein